MLVVPFLAGVVLRQRGLFLDWYLVPLFAFWMLGYLTFNAASGWLKAAPARRRSYLKPLVSYGSLTAAMGLWTLWLAGPAQLWWLPVFVPPVAGALWLASRRRERVLLGGALTVAAASLMTLVVRFPSPLDLMSAWGGPAVTTAIIVTGFVFGYFFGTVLYVKTMIRERGELAWLNASIAWHAGLTIIAAVLAWSGQVGRVWPLFFLATTIRAWFMPHLAEGRPVSPKVVGFVEIGFSVALLVAVALG